MFNVKDDVRIEIMQALLNNAVISKEGFSAIANLFEDVEGANAAAWANYKAMFGVSSATTSATDLAT